MIISPIFAIDGYKLGHRAQYPNGTTRVYSNFTPRANKYLKSPFFKALRGDEGSPILWVGAQTFMLQWLVDEFQNNFFNRDAHEVVEKFRASVNSYLYTDFDVKPFYELHALGYLPIHVKAVPEGNVVEVKCPPITIINTLDDFYWIPNYLETLMSAELWPVATSATTALSFRLMSEYFAELTCDNKDHIQWQGHDFAARGSMGMWANSLTGTGHLFAFNGTDSVFARERFNEHYPTDAGRGGSVNATEHSVMCMGGKEDERQTFIRLLTEVYPTGILSVVSDTWDFWSVLTTTLPSIKDIIMERDGKLVVRPDSGVPEDIICGFTVVARFKDENIAREWMLNDANDLPEKGAYVVQIGDEYFTYAYFNGGYFCVTKKSEAEVKGAIQILWDTFGGEINSKGYKVLAPQIGLIYGDSISLERQLEIFQRLKAKGFASSNVVLGIGSFTYQYVTRDTLGWAMKATWGIVNGEAREIFKDPATDDGTKKSAKGLMAHFVDESGNWTFKDQATVEEEADTALVTIYRNGETFTESGDDVLARIESYVDRTVKEAVSKGLF